MKLLSILFLLAGGNCSFLDDDLSPEDTVFEGTSGNNGDGIIGGNFIAITNSPHQAQLLFDGNLECGATLISSSWLVTAAHCLYQVGGKLEVIVGSDLPEKGRRREVEFRIFNKDYNKYTSEHDIGLIKLKDPIEINADQKPIEILGRPPRVGDEVEVSGFGKDKVWSAGNSQQLKATVVPVVDSEKCEKGYESLKRPKFTAKIKITQNMFCAGEGGTDTCQGDSGGPALIEGKLAGVTSFGLECASYTAPGVYTVVYNYLSWIQRVTGVETKPLL